MCAGPDDRYRGQQGSNAFYIGGGKVISIYDKKPLTISEYKRRHLMIYKSVKDQVKYPDPKDFQITGNRRPIVMGN